MKNLTRCKLKEFKLSIEFINTIASQVKLNRLFPLKTEMEKRGNQVGLTHCLIVTSAINPCKQFGS